MYESVNKTLDKMFKKNFNSPCISPTIVAASIFLEFMVEWFADDKLPQQLLAELHNLTTEKYYVCIVNLSESIILK